MKSFCLVLLGVLLSFFGYTQRVCLTDSRTAVSTEGSTANGFSRDTIPNEVINIPVVVHVLFNAVEQNISDEQVRSQIIALNNDFRRLNADKINTPELFAAVAADTRINFCLAQVDPQGRPSKGIVHRYTTVDHFLGDDAMKFTAAGGDDAWDTKKYLNIWVCNLFGRSLGYATMPGEDPAKDGVVIKYDVFGTIGNLRFPFNLGRTATHEVGHWLGLKHIWGDDYCGDDGIYDTPQQLSYNYNCPSFPHQTSCSPASGEMFMNFMDLSNDACMNLFTVGQKQKMRSLFANGGIRNAFLQSFACDSSLAAGAPLPDDTIPVAKPAATVYAYPNPVQQLLNLDSNDGYVFSGKWIQVYDLTGARQLAYLATGNKPSIPVQKLKPGIYLIRIGEGTDARVLKVLKQ
jgi:hypothetical protein